MYTPHPFVTNLTMPTYVLKQFAIIHSDELSIQVWNIAISDKNVIEKVHKNLTYISLVI